MKIETKESKGMKKSVAMKTFALIIGIIIMLTAAYIIVSPTTYKISPENFDKIYNSEDFLTVTEANNYTLNNKIISVKGEVIYIASPDLSGVRHERFVISDGNTSLVVIYNIDFLGRGFLNPEIGDRVILVGFKQDSLKYLTGKTLAEVAALRGKSAEETAMDLVIDNNADVSCVYFLMSEENVKKQIALPWVSFCSDSESSAPEGVFLKSSTHPRAYGNFARLLGKYVRDEKVLSLEEAVRKLTSLPAHNLRLDRRGLLKPGYYADLAIFDPDKIQDHATYEKPKQFATGMVHVFVNGEQVIKDGEHTGALPGRFVKPVRK